MRYPPGLRECDPASSALLRPPLPFVLFPAAESPSHCLHSHGNSGRRAALGGKGSPRGDKGSAGKGGREVHGKGEAPEKREECKKKRHRRAQPRSGETELGKAGARGERTGAGDVGRAGGTGAWWEPPQQSSGHCAWPEVQEKRPERPFARPQTALPAGKPLPSGASEAYTGMAEAWLWLIQETPELAEGVSRAGVEETQAARKYQVDGRQRELKARPGSSRGGTEMNTSG